MRLRIDAVCGVRVERGFRNCSSSVLSADWDGTGGRVRERSGTGTRNATFSLVGAEVVAEALSLDIETSGSVARKASRFAGIGDRLLCLQRGLHNL